MSAKWIRSKQWDDEHIPSWAWPVRFILRAFSSITLAVVLLSLVVVYAILASVPVGLIVLGLTYLVYGLTLLSAVGLIGLGPILLLRAAWNPPRRRGARFVASLLLGLAFSAAAVYLWQRFAWPRLQYDATTGSGLRLFAGFVDQYRSTTLRRLPGVEMSELEFYSWWPLRVVLLLFVVNMVTATVRRIEFTFPNLGVLTVHTGIVTIALGSVYYKGLKKEGDTLLMAGPLGADGTPTPGPPQSGFYDNTRVALWTRLGDSNWEQRPIQPPRYNDYNLSAGGGVTVLDTIGRVDAGRDDRRTLDVRVPRPDRSGLDPSLSFRLVGYASYAEPKPTWVKAPPPAEGKPQPVRFAELIAQRGDAADPARTVMTAPFFFLPELPAQRLGETELFGLEYIRGISPQHFADLTSELPAGAQHALIVDVPARDGQAAVHGVYKVEPGQKVAVGESGYVLEVKELAPQPPFPIITDGYRGATSSVAIVRVTPPTVGGAEPKPFERWVYHRFPEISQDLLDELNERGMPKRRDADPSIRIAYIDASKLQVYLDETVVENSATGAVRAIIRQAAGPVRVVSDIAPGGRITGLMPGLDLKLTYRWDHAEQEERPEVVAERGRDRAEIGTHSHAMLAVEVSTSGDSGPTWSKVIWLPFTRYLMAGMGTERSLELPDGRHLSLAFGRVYYPLPGFVILLRDFRMIAYDHRGSPRDYQSLLQVVPSHDAGEMAFKPYTHLASLNAPLQAPFHWDEERSWLANAVGTISSRLSARQFKFSQAGWDQRGWAETQQLVDQGRLPRPYVTFTILGVGNNPGIHLVALGAILMSVGIPWAFYIKPLIMRRRRAKLKAAVDAGTYRRSETPPSVVESPGEPQHPQPIGPGA